MGNQISRQGFLNLLTGLVTTSFGQVAFAEEHSRDTFVMIFLRGACDGLNFAVPLAGEDRRLYEAARPNLKIPMSGEEGVIKLTEQFGLHPSARPFLDLFQDKKLAFVHAAGLTANTRSHFDAQNLVELGTPDSKTTASGWIARHLHSVNAPEGQLPSISLSTLNPTSLLSYSRALSINDPRRVSLPGDKNIQAVQREFLRDMYASQNTPVHKAGREALTAIELIESRHPEKDLTKVGVEYPKCEIGNRLKSTAQLLKMNLGVQVATIDMGGWDTHKYQGTGTEGTYAKLVDQLTSSVKAFYSDLNDSSSNALSKKTTIVIMTEFGRRLRENANKGTDHGHGGLMMLLGDHVNGGKFYGKWPGLKSEDLYERADLAVTTDFREVLSELLMRRLKNNNMAMVFPGFVRAGLMNIFSEA